jgi:hypothetical protein
VMESSMTDRQRDAFFEFNGFPRFIIMDSAEVGIPQ